MNNLTLKFLAFCLMFSAFALFYGCSGDNSGQKDTESNLTAEMAYACPMRCEGSGSNEPGKCSVCGMDLIKVGSEQEHSHGDGDEDGHDHGDDEHEHADEEDHGEDGDHEHGEEGHEGHDH